MTIHPPFSENEDNIEAFMMDKKAKELLLEELVCFHTKMPLKANTLGIGISIKKSPKTGKFSFVNPIMDLLNMRAYTKLKIRNSLTAEKFTHWLPLYFGENETYTIESESYNHEERKFETEKKVINTQERFEKYLSSSLSYIANGSTLKPYNHESVVEVIPQLISTHVLALMKEIKHIDINSIRRLFNFIRLWTYLSSKDDKIQAKVDVELDQFIAKPENRIKEVCGNLLVMQTYAVLSDKTNYTEFTKAYCDEQIDR